jgi:hypothetical protein
MSNLVVPIRLFCDLVTPNTFTDINRNNAQVFFFRGDDIQFDFGLGYDGVLITATAPSSGSGWPVITNIGSITAQIFQNEADTNPPMMSGTTSTINDSLTQTDWNNDTTPFVHASIVFPGSQTAITLNGQTSINYWLRVTAQTTDNPPKIITVLDGPITVKDGPISSASAPPLAQFRLYTVAGQIVPQILDTSTGLYHTLNILNDNGVLTLQLSDQGY